MNINRIIKAVYGLKGKGYYTKALSKKFTPNQIKYIQLVTGKQGMPKEISQLLGKKNIKIPKRITKSSLQQLEKQIRKEAPDRGEYLLNQMMNYIDKYPTTYGTALVVRYIAPLDMEDLAFALAKAEEEGFYFEEQYYRESDQEVVKWDFIANTYHINKYLGLDFNTVNDMMYNEVNSDEI